VIFASNRNVGSTSTQLYTMPLSTAPLGTPVEVSQNLPSGASDDYPSRAPAAAIPPSSAPVATIQIGLTPTRWRWEGAGFPRGTAHFDAQFGRVPAHAHPAASTRPACPAPSRGPSGQVTASGPLAGYRPCSTGRLDSRTCPDEQSSHGKDESSRRVHLAVTVGLPARCVLTRIAPPIGIGRSPGLPINQRPASPPLRPPPPDPPPARSPRPSHHQGG